MGQQVSKLLELDECLTPEECLTSILVEEQRLQKCWITASNQEEKTKYLAQLKNLVQTKQALKSEIDSASALPPLTTHKDDAPIGDSNSDSDSASLNTSDNYPQPNSKVVYELGSITPKPQSPPRRRKIVTLTASLLAVTAAGVFVSQSDFYFQKPPQVAVEQQSDQLLLLVSEIDELIARMNSIESDLKDSLDAATKDVQNITDKKSLVAARSRLVERQATYDLSQQVIFKGSIHTDLQQRKIQTDLLIQQKQFQSAIPTLLTIKQGYLDLLANLDEANTIYPAQGKALSKQRDWMDFKQKYEVGSLKIENGAKGLLLQAETERDTGQLILAHSSFQKTSDAYQGLLDSPEAREAIVAFRRKQIIASVKKEMIKIPTGYFRMGDLTNEGDINEQPVHEVRIKSFALKKTEVTFEQYDIFVDSTNRPRPDDGSWGRGDRPVINVSWYDAVAYAEWLSEQTGDKFRLPTEAEWEYAARAERETKYSWGDKPSALEANGNEVYDWPADGYIKKTAPVASFNPNDFGLNDMIGNVQEWTQDCWKFTYQLASPQGKAMNKGDCSKRVRRGGSWVDAPTMLRTSKRYWSTANVKSSIGGFRLAQDLEPPEKPKKESTQNNSTMNK